MPPRKPETVHCSPSVNFHDDDFIERMARRSAFYITAFDEHAKIVRTAQKQDVMEAYHRLIAEGRVVPPNSTPRTTLSSQDQESMDEKLRSHPRDTLDNIVLFGLTAHTLLLSQLAMMKELPYNIMKKVDRRTIELRSEMKRNLSEQDSNPNPTLYEWTPTRSLPPAPRPLTPLSRTLGARQTAIDDSMVHDLMRSPISLIGMQFILNDINMCYRIVSMFALPEDITFSIQYEGTGHPAHDVSRSELESMLRGSSIESM